MNPNFLFLSQNQMREIIKTTTAEFTTKSMDATPMDPYLSKLISEETGDLKRALMAQLSDHLDQIIYRQAVSTIREESQKKIEQFIQQQKFQQMKPRNKILPVKQTIKTARPPKPPRKHLPCKPSTLNKLKLKLKQ